MDYALVSVLLAVVSLIFTITLLLSLKKLTNDIPHLAHDFMQQALTDMAPEIQNAIAQGLTEGLRSAAGSVLAKRSAVSRQMKAAEKQVIGAAVDQVVPGAGSMAAGFIQKYPFLLNFLQKFQEKGSAQTKGRGKM